MSVKGHYTCDWRECEHNGGAMDGRMMPPIGFLTVRETEVGAGDVGDLHFCSWDCVLKHAAEKEPTEFVPAGPLPSD